MNEITIAVKEPAKSWHAVKVENTLPEFQKIVSGYIEHFESTASGIHFFCNEEGKFQGLKPNVTLLNGDTVVGTIFAVRSNDDGEFESLTNDDLDDLLLMGA